MLAFLLSADNVIGFVLYVVAGVLGGLLLLLIILGRLAEKAAYSQIAGQPGAVGAVLKSSLRRGWTASEMPVAVSPRTQDADLPGRRPRRRRTHRRRSAQPHPADARG